MNTARPHAPLKPDPEAIEATAAVWLSLRDRGLTKAETAECMRWLQQDARHAEIFNELDATWREFDRAKVIRPPDGETPDANLLAPRARPSRRRRFLAAALATAAALALTWVGVKQLNPRPTLETAIGAFQKMDLPDGSIVQLNTDSAINVVFSPAERRVTLLRGEAHFDVTKNPARPFIVSAGSVAVRAVGTAFNVRLRPQAVEVLVTEGRVAVNDVVKGTSLLGENAAGGDGVLHVHERAVIALASVGPTAAPATLVAELPPTEIERTLAWQERRLEFDGTPLAEAVEEFNRYNGHKLVITDPRLAAKRFGGSFRADGYDSFVRLLEENFAVTAEVQDGRTLLRLAR